MSPRMHRKQAVTVGQALEELEGASKSAAKQLKEALNKGQDPVEVADATLDEVAGAARRYDEAVKGAP